MMKLLFLTLLALSLMACTSIEKNLRVADTAKETRIKYTLRIDVNDDNSVEVNGPIGHPLLCMEVLGEAMKTIVSYNLNKGSKTK